MRGGVVLGIRTGIIDRHSDGMFREYDVTYRRGVIGRTRLSQDFELTSFIKGTIGNLNSAYYLPL